MTRKRIIIFLTLFFAQKAHADMIDQLITDGRETYCQWAFEIMFKGIDAREANQPEDPKLLARSWDSLTPQTQKHFSYYFHLGYSMADRAIKLNRREPRLYGLSYKSCMGRKDLRQLEAK